jgi:thioredoxin reductase (NADPH)
MRDHDLIVVGAGVAGLTAAMVAGHHGLDVVVIAPTGAGGQIINAERVENFPGFPQGIAGHELGTLLFEQAEAAGAQFELDQVESLAADGDDLIVRTSTTQMRAGAVIVAAGSSHRPLGIPGEEMFLGRGVSYCATCDGPLFKGRDVAVVGGGDTAFDEALVLANYAARVTIFHQGETPRAQQRLRKLAAGTRNVAIESETAVEGIIGHETLTGLLLRQKAAQARREQKLDGVFVAAGLDPASAFLRGVVALDPAGHVETDAMMRASLPGVFAAGDIRRGSVALLAAVAGDGATAAIAAFRYLNRLV